MVTEWHVITSCQTSYTVQGVPLSNSELKVSILSHYMYLHSIMFLLFWLISLFVPFYTFVFYRKYIVVHTLLVYSCVLYINNVFRCFVGRNEQI